MNVQIFAPWVEGRYWGDPRPSATAKGARADTPAFPHHQSRTSLPLVFRLQGTLPVKGCPQWELEGSPQIQEGALSGTASMFKYWEIMVASGLGIKATAMGAMSLFLFLADGLKGQHLPLGNWLLLLGLGYALLYTGLSTPQSRPEQA